MEVNINNLVTLRRYVFITGMSYDTLRSWVDGRRGEIEWDQIHDSNYGLYIHNGIFFYKIGDVPFVDVNQSRLDEKYVK